jgi:hypothetical protein
VFGLTLFTTRATKSIPFFKITEPPFKVVSELPIASFHLVVATAAVPVILIHILLNQRL